MNHNDPELQTLWSPMSRAGHARFAALRAALRSAYAPPSPAQRLQRKYAAGARRSGDAIFFETFGSPEQLLRMGDHDELCAELVAPPSSRREPEPEPILGGGHVSRLAKPTRLPTPTRLSLKRPRADDETQQRVRKPRLSDATNLVQTATTTTTSMNPWDRYHHHHVLKPSAVSRVEASAFQPTPVTTSAFAAHAPRPHTHTTSTRAFALR